MTQFDNTNTGVLFKNDQANNDKRPAYKGKINVDGREYEIAGWKKVGKSGVAFLSLKVQQPRPKPPSDAWVGKPAVVNGPPVEPFEDDLEIPF